MSGQTSDGVSLRECPNCGALITVRVVVCTSCGINIAAYTDAAQRIRQIRAAHEEAQSRAAAVDAETLSATEKAAGRKSFVRAVRLGAVLFLMVALVTLMATFLLATDVRERRARVALTYRQAQSCLLAADYRCARDGLVAVLALEPAYPGAEHTLTEVYARWQADELAGGHPIGALMIRLEGAIRLRKLR